MEADRSRNSRTLTKRMGPGSGSMCMQLCMREKRFGVRDPRPADAERVLFLTPGKALEFIGALDFIMDSARALFGSGSRHSSNWCACSSTER